MRTEVPLKILGRLSLHVHKELLIEYFDYIPEFEHSVIPTLQRSSNKRDSKPNDKDH